MAIAWGKVLSFVGQHAATGLTAVGGAQAAGVTMTPREMLALFLTGAIAGGVNHTRETATVTKPTEPVPTPEGLGTPTVPLEPPAPVLTLEQRFGDQADAIYREIMGRPTSRTDGGVEKYDACVLLRDGKEADLRRELNNRK